MKKRTIIITTAAILILATAAVWFCTAPRIRELTEEEERSLLRGPTNDEVSAYRNANFGEAEDPSFFWTVHQMLRGMGTAFVGTYLSTENVKGGTARMDKLRMDCTFQITEILADGRSILGDLRPGDTVILRCYGQRDGVFEPTLEPGASYLIFPSLYRDRLEAVEYECVHRVDDRGRITWQNAWVREAAKLEGITTLRAVKAALRRLAKG